jgi:hypothetical protein
MEPFQPPPADTPDLSHVRIDILRRAIEVYLALAYVSSPIPEAVRRRLEWRDDASVDANADAAQLLSHSPFERVGKSAGTLIFALRLGNARYPHMKLQIQPWPNAAGFILTVNTHDQVLALDPGAADAAAFRALQAENQRLKEAIEHAWDQAGLPTFLRYLRDYIESRADTPEPPPAAGPEAGASPAS